MSAGSLDVHFGNGGVAYSDATDFGLAPGSFAIPAAVAVDSIGRIIVAGQTFGANGWDFEVARYLPDGSLDSSFGNRGSHTIDPGSPYGLYGAGFFRDSLAIDSHDRILIGGTSYFSSVVNGDGDTVIGGGQFSIVRL
jgi:hypothetical protein